MDATSKHKFHGGENICDTRFTRQTNKETNKPTKTKQVDIAVA